MYPRDDEDRIVLEPFFEDPDVYVKPFIRLDEADQRVRALEGELSSREMAPYRDELESCWSDVEDLFRTALTIEEAEKFYRRLGAAILRAKVWRGQFTYYDEEDR
jgi:hypothetical protein